MRHSLDTWLKARRDYVQGKGFLPDVARRYGLPVGTVQTRGKREKWSSARAVFMARKLVVPGLEPPAVPTPPPETPNSYVSQRLSRVRLQLARLDDLIEAESDPHKLDRLASAQARLAEQERIMAGRPLPSSMRPRATDNRPERRRLEPDDDGTPPVPASSAPADTQPLPEAQEATSL
jgi:hypothetical protein